MYIGITSETLHKRNLKHLRKVKFGSNTNFHKAIRKYGISNLKLEILEIIETNLKKEAYELEQSYINKFNSYNKGYNMNLFGWNISDKSGKNNPMFGKISGNASKCSINNIIYNSITEASKKLSKNRNTILRWINTRENCFKI